MKNKYLITGITGFLGQALTEHLLRQNVQVIGLARNEGQIVKFKEKFPSVPVFLGDVSNRWTVKRAMNYVDGVFHLAATKSVDIAEQQPYQTIQTNVIGTQVILQESFRVKPRFVLFISTDKAAQVKGVYGATKMLGEKLFEEAQDINHETDYRVVRYGNVLNSTGSVVPKWREKIARGEKIQITDPEMTRFFWSVDDAIKLIFDCLANAKDPKPYVPEMKSMKMGDLLEAVQQKYGRTEVEIIGNRGGENMHEKILEQGPYSNEVEHFTIDEIIPMI